MSPTDRIVPHPRLALLALGAVAAGLLLLGPGASVPAAHAQSAACPQYQTCPNPPGGGNVPTGGGGETNPSAGQGGQLPFTGYPVTPLILLLAALLAAGAMIRAYIAARDRLLARHAPAGYFPPDLG